MNLLYHLSLPAPTHSSLLFTASQHILSHLFPAKTLSNKSGIYSALNAKAGHWLLVLAGQNILSEIICFQEKNNKTSPVATGNSICTCLSSLGLEADKQIFLLSKCLTTCLCVFLFTYKRSHCFLSIS